MARSRRKKKRRKRKPPKQRARQRSGPPSISAARRELEQAGYEVFAIKIVDEVDPKLQRAVGDEMFEATMLLKRGRLQEARAMFEKIIARQPRVQEAYTNLAAIHLKSGDVGTGEAILLKTIEKFPRYAYPRANLAQQYLRRGLVDEAEDILMPGGKMLRKFSTGEFRFYMLTYSDVLAHKNNYAAALSGLKMLSHTLPGSHGCGAGASATGSGGCCTGGERRVERLGIGDWGL